MTIDEIGQMTDYQLQIYLRPESELGPGKHELTGQEAARYWADRRQRRRLGELEE